MKPEGKERLLRRIADGIGERARAVGAWARNLIIMLADLAVCDGCHDICPFRHWDDARAAGWDSTTWDNPPENHAVFCPECWRSMNSGVEW